AYVFTRQGTAWTLQQKLTAYDGGTYDFFGTAVALDGDTLAVGATSAPIQPYSKQGSVYVFTRHGTAWTLQQKLTGVSLNGAYDDFGSAVALDGDTLVVGAPRDPINVFDEFQGVAYIFTRSGSVWTQRAKLTPTNATAENYFGSSVAVNN